MRESHLRACPTCARHVRVTEAACPFCGGALSAAFRAAAAPLPPRTTGLTRAALFALGTGTLAFAPGCSSSPSSVVDGGGGGSEDSSAPIVDAAYGGPPIGDSGGVAPVYGAPPTTDGGGGIAAYGGAPIETDGGH
jgi:hypothetical protein